MLLLLVALCAVSTPADAQVRRGSIDLLGKLLGDEDPSYWDAFGKLDYQLGPRNSLRANLLYSDDSLVFSEVVDTESKLIDTEYRNGYAWLTHEAILGERAFVETAGSLSRVDRDHFTDQTHQELVLLNLVRKDTLQA